METPTVGLDVLPQAKSLVLPESTMLVTVLLCVALFSPKFVDIEGNSKIYASGWGWLIMTLEL